MRRQVGRFTLVTGLRMVSTLPGSHGEQLGILNATLLAQLYSRTAFLLFLLVYRHDELLNTKGSICSWQEILFSETPVKGLTLRCERHSEFVTCCQNAPATSRARVT